MNLQKFAIFMALLAMRFLQSLLCYQTSQPGLCRSRLETLCSALDRTCRRGPAKHDLFRRLDAILKVLSVSCRPPKFLGFLMVTDRYLQAVP